MVVVRAIGDNKKSEGRRGRRWRNASQRVVFGAVFQPRMSRLARRKQLVFSGPKRGTARVCVCVSEGRNRSGSRRWVRVGCAARGAVARTGARLASAFLYEETAVGRWP